ncbi:MAG TPA: hypothetical protein VFB78_05115 [Acidimicrobiales bacterium]|nr:hypothetical protein [Acidimicrobiales bacterium]
MARRWWHRRRRQRQLGYLLYGFAAVLVVVGVLAVTSGRGGTKQVRATDPAVSRPIRTVPVDTTDTTAAPKTIDPDPNVNSAPVITAPASVNVLAEGFTQVPGMSIDDLEAHANGDVIGVILYAPNGTIRLGRTVGLQVFQPNPGPWIPFTGRLDAINAALAQVGYQPKASSSGQTIQILTSDFGGPSKQKVQSARKTIGVRVTR